MEWVRLNQIGQGSYATISLAATRKGTSPALFPPLMAVKTSEAIHCASLRHEKQVLDHLGHFCPQIIRCYGDSHTTENREEFYNIFLEYASGGSLASKIGGKLPEFEVRKYTRAILKGLGYIHSKGVVHCDIKRQNILLLENGDLKIADFGLAVKKTGEGENRGGGETEGRRVEIRGTPLYMAPEAVNGNEYVFPSDVWALGCVVVEMVTGKPAWDRQAGSNMYALMIRIGVGGELPNIPSELSEEGRDFLGKCFVKDPKMRWTAEMLLNHPFVRVCGDDDDDDNNCTVKMDRAGDESPKSPKSPRCPFDFGVWDSMHSNSSILPESWSEIRPAGFSASDRLRELVTREVVDWSVSDSWVTLR